MMAPGELEGVLGSSVTRPTAPSVETCHHSFLRCLATRHGNDRVPGEDATYVQTMHVENGLAYYCSTTYYESRVIVLLQAMSSFLSCCVARPATGVSG